MFLLLLIKLQDCYHVLFETDEYNGMSHWSHKNRLYDYEHPNTEINTANVILLDHFLSDQLRYTSAHLGNPPPFVYHKGKDENRDDEEPPWIAGERLIGKIGHEPTRHQCWEYDINKQKHPSNNRSHLYWILLLVNQRIHCCYSWASLLFFRKTLVVRQSQLECGSLLLIAYERRKQLALLA